MYDIARFKDDILNSRTASLLSNAVTDVQDAYQKGGVGRAVGKAIGANVGGAMLVPAAITDDVLNAASPVTSFAGEVGKGLLGIDGAPAATAAPGVSAPPTAVSSAAAKLPDAPQPSTTAPAIAAPAQSAQGGYGMDQGGVIGQQTSVPGITKLTGGGFKSPMFTDDPARAMAQYQGGQGGQQVASAAPSGIAAPPSAGTVNTVPAASFGAGPSPGASAGVSAALQAAAARGDFQSIADYYQRDGGTFNGKTAAQDRIDALQKTITAPNGNMSIGDMIAAKARNKLALGQIAALREQPRLDAQTAAQTAQAAAQTQGILAGIPLTQAKTQSEAADARIKQQHADLTRQLADTDPADTAKITELRSRLNQIAGKTSDQQDKYILADVDTGQVDAMGQPIFKKVPFNQRTGEYAGKEAVQGDRKAKADAITAQYQAGKLSREEASAQLAALGYKK
jgi:hypothetical protein